MARPAQLIVELFPAGIGDALLLRCVSADRSTNILVDGGVRTTYDDYLASRLRELRSQGEKLDLVTVTHIDTDHIGGVLKLLKANGRANAPAVIEICDIWHNGYRHLGLQGRKPTEAEKRKVLSQVSAAEGNAGQPGDISVREGDTLARLISEGGYAWNKAWGGTAVVAGKTTAIAPGVEVTVLSPGQGNLQSLAYEWRRGLQSMGVSFEAVDSPDFEDAFEKALPRLDAETVIEDTDISAALGCEPPDPSMFVEDTSFTNGSSIAFLLECYGLRALFLGDSWPSVIADQWEKLPSDVARGDLDLLKASHHGSRHNTSPALAKRISAKTYVFSTDGSKHGHPNIEALLWIADGCAADAALVFNYPSGPAERMNQPDARTRFGHRVTMGTGKVPIVLTFDGEDVHGPSER